MKTVNELIERIEEMNEKYGRQNVAATLMTLNMTMMMFNISANEVIKVFKEDYSEQGMMWSEIIQYLIVESDIELMEKMIELEQIGIFRTGMLDNLN